MITDDPIRDLERQLVAAARETALDPAPPGRRRPRWVLALPAAGALAAAAIALVALLGSGASAPSLAQAAYARLNPEDAVVELTYDTRFYDGGRVYQHVRARVSYSATHERSVATSIGPRGRRAVGFLEVIRSSREIRSYESRTRTLTIQANCQRSGVFPRSTAADPIARLRSLAQRRRIRERGSTTFDGRRVSRLVADDAGEQLVYLVTPKSAEPVAMTLRPLARSVAGGRFTGTVVRFRSHRHLPDDSSRAQLAMRPHPGATIVNIGASRCRHR